WFAGYTPNLASAVFVGDPRGPQNYPPRNVTIADRYFGQVYGADIPRPIWQETLSKAVEKVPERGVPGAPGKFRGGGGGGAGAQPTATNAAVEGGVPDVVGPREREAVAALEDAGYPVGVAPNRVRSAEAEGTVAAVNPGPGTVLPE